MTCTIDCPMGCCPQELGYCRHGSDDCDCEPNCSACNDTGVVPDLDCQCANCTYVDGETKPVLELIQCIDGGCGVCAQIEEDMPYVVNALY